MESLIEKFNLADSLYLKGKFDKALEIYLYLYSEDFRKIEVLEKIVWIYFNNYDFDNAEKYIEIYLAENPLSTDILSAKVCILFKNQQFDDALSICDKMIEIDSNSQIAYSFKLSLLEILHRDSEREEIIKYLKDEKKDIFNNLNFFDNATQRTLQNNSSFNDFYYKVENQNINKKSDNPIYDFFDKMIEEMTKTNDDLALYNFLISDKNDKNDEFNALVSKAKEFADEGKYNLALEYVNWALEFYPNNIETLIFKTSILINLEEYNQGLLTIDLVLQLNKKNITALIIKGLIYIKLEEYTLAQELFKDILEIDNNNLLLYRHYYMSIAIGGDIEHANEICKESISKFPQEKDLYRDKHYFEKIIKNNKLDKQTKQNLDDDKSNEQSTKESKSKEIDEDIVGDKPLDSTSSSGGFDSNTSKKSNKNKKSKSKKDLNQSQLTLDYFF
ncbi:tetratricopeptide repeat protein [Methanobrevibacter sp.]